MTIVPPPSLFTRTINEKTFSQLVSPIRRLLEDFRLENVQEKINCHGISPQVLLLLLLLHSLLLIQKRKKKEIQKKASLESWVTRMMNRHKTIGGCWLYGTHRSLISIQQHLSGTDESAENCHWAAYKRRLIAATLVSLRMWITGVSDCLSVHSKHHMVIFRYDSAEKESQGMPSH